MTKKKPLPPGCIEKKQGKSIRYVCPCGILFSSKKALWEHWIEFHSPEGEQKYKIRLEAWLMEHPEDRLKLTIAFPILGSKKALLQQLAEVLERFLADQRF